MYLITNRNLCHEKRYMNVIKESILSGIENIIIREKDLDNDSLVKLYTKIKETLEKIKQKDKSKRYNVNLIINSNLDVFEKTNADGIHLTLSLFKKLVNNKFKFNKDKILGLSLHSIKEIFYVEEIIKKYDIKIDYIILSHIYETKCKEGLQPKGIDLLKEARKITNLKIVALGGILPENIHKIEKYCDDFAVMSTIMKSKDVFTTINSYLREYKYSK
ncbi:thiamine phosphate synthase [Faecalimicrobium dakarense]|uniref:thiamine phosphate synthase n=1 Tax=Faecalimicrobium dakarense TaxID=1301100 RepID=UPI0004AED67A|nr:thiamine phosphate synthase [[Clostridium] dakarense]